MNIVEKKFYGINPRYLAQHEALLKRFAQFGGGAEKEKFIKGRAFSNVYEFYMYAFFLGLYKNRAVEISEEDKLKDFWEIRNWQPSELVESLLVSAIAKSKFDMLLVQSLDKDSDITREINKIKNTIESYANGGFNYIAEEIENNPDGAEQDDFFIKMLV